MKILFWVPGEGVDGSMFLDLIEGQKSLEPVGTVRGKKKLDRLRKIV